MTTTTDEKNLLLKTDALGRVHMPRDRREAILDAFESSAMSGQAFAAHIGVKYPTFMTWAQKREKSQ
jgi:DNA-binding transcriptional regulator YiaG